MGVEMGLRTMLPFDNDLDVLKGIRHLHACVNPFDDLFFNTSPLVTLSPCGLCCHMLTSVQQQHL